MTQHRNSATGQNNYSLKFEKIDSYGKVNSKTSPDTWSDLKPLNVKNETAVIAAIQWFNESTYISKFKYTLKSVVPPQQNSSAKQHRAILSFKLTELYAPHLILLRGIFEFSNPSLLFVTVDRIDQTVTAEVNSDDAEVVTRYLETIFNQLAKEIAFKANLKKVIAWEKNIKQEQSLLYNTLHTLSL
jgi:hypothetical protein